MTDRPRFFVEDLRHSSSSDIGIYPHIPQPRQATVHDVSPDDVSFYKLSPQSFEKALFPFGDVLVEWYGEKGSREKSRRERTFEYGITTKTNVAFTYDSFATLFLPHYQVINGKQVSMLDQLKGQTENPIHPACMTVNLATAKHDPGSYIDEANIIASALYVAGKFHNLFLTDAPSDSFREATLDVISPGINISIGDDITELVGKVANQLEPSQQKTDNSALHPFTKGPLQHNDTLYSAHMTQENSIDITRNTSTEGSDQLALSIPYELNCSEFDQLAQGPEWRHIRERWPIKLQAGPTILFK